MASDTQALDIRSGCASFTFVLHFPELFADKENTLGQGFSKCTAASAASGNVLKAGSHHGPTPTDFVSKKILGEKGVRDESNLVLRGPPGNSGAQ